MSSQILRAGSLGEAVSVGGSPLPGVITGMRVRGTFEVEKKRMEGTSGSANLPKGFRDAAVEITLELVPPNVTAQIKQLEAAFKQGGVTSAKPQRIVNPHLDARGIVRVLFTGLDTEDGNEWDTTLATLSFIEYEPLVAINEARTTTPTVSGPAASLNADSGSGAGGSAATQTPSVADSFSSGSSAGAADANTSKTPAFLSDVTAGTGATAGFIGSSGGR